MFKGSRLTTNSPEKDGGKGKMKWFLVILAAVALVGVIVLNVVTWHSFNHDIGGDAPSINQADQYAWWILIIIMYMISIVCNIVAWLVFFRRW